MIEHVVLFRIKASISEEQMHEASVELRKMKEVIPGIVDLSSGVNKSSKREDHGYGLGLVVRFPDANALDTYQSHPYHREVVEKFILPLVEDIDGIVVVDYEIG